MSYSNGHVPKFTRTSSQICPSPEDELLEAVLINNTAKVSEIAQKNLALLSHTYPTYNKRILHIACSEDGVTAKTVERLLDLRANPRDHTDDDGWEAIHWAAQKSDPDILETLLRRNSGDVNVVDMYGNNALQILIRHGNRDSPNFQKCVEVLIRKGIDVSHKDNKNKTALQWAEKKGVLEMVQCVMDDLNTSQTNAIMNNNTNNDKDDGRTLMDLLKQRQTEDFVNFRNGNIGHLVDYRDDNCTLLQMSCRKDLPLAVEHLCTKGADPNLVGSKDTTKPLVIAAENGSGIIFGQLLQMYETLWSIPEGLLAIILKNIDSNTGEYSECYKAYMSRMSGDPDEISMKLNEKDENSNSALHYAIKFADAEIVDDLLSRGASLGAKNNRNMMPIEDIEPKVLEKHLDNCVIFDRKKIKEIEKEDFEVKFNYRSIIPPYAKPRYNDVMSLKDLEAAGMKSTIEKEMVAETEVIFFMSKSQEFKHLLKHPVIVSFLFMKWLRVQWLFWINLLFYITFSLALVIYIFTDYAYFSSEDKSNGQILLAKLSYVILIITLLILMLRELFQICVAPMKYFLNIENYIEIILIVITAMMVFIKEPSKDTEKQLSSLAILLAAFELVLMLGQHPYFSTNVVMLRTVSYNFFKFLIWYSLLIVAFALSFYLLFTTGNDNETSLVGIDKKNDTDDEEGRDFENPGNSVFKTIIMLTGEFDASDLNFNTFPVTSKLIFALFIFMIAIILLNLLNGLAVSDTQMIKNDAELVGHIARTEHIRYVETMLVGNILPINIMKKLRELCCCLPVSRNRNFRIGKLLSSACLFPRFLNYELSFKPNKNGLVQQHTDMRPCIGNSCLPCSAIYLDKDTIRRTKDIIQATREVESSKVSRLHEEMGEMKRKIDQMLKMMNDMRS